MRQLQFFTNVELAAMRDRTKARNYSPEADEFRREHARHRNWGLARRHARKLCRSQGCSTECAAVGLHDYSERVPPLIWDDDTTRAQPAPGGEAKARRGPPASREQHPDPARPVDQPPTASPTNTATHTAGSQAAHPAQTADPQRVADRAEAAN